MVDLSLTIFQGILQCQYTDNRCIAEHNTITITFACICIGCKVNPEIWSMTDLPFSIVTFVSVNLKEYELTAKFDDSSLFYQINDDHNITYFGIHFVWLNFHLKIISFIPFVIKPFHRYRKFKEKCTQSLGAPVFFLFFLSHSNSMH